MISKEIPLVSVCIRSHNQEKFIAQAIDSVLMQKTTFPFEIIIGDDNSKDNSINILDEYTTNNPELIHVLKSEVKLGGAKNLRQTIEHSKAKYIALCDGDDYWTDVYKLQKQVDFLEQHKEYIACFHNVINIYENNEDKSSFFHSAGFPQHHTYETVVKNKWFLPINGLVFIREYVFFPNWFDNVKHDDYVMDLALASKGSFYIMRDVMAVYRHHGNNMSSNFDIIQFDNEMSTILYKMKKYYPLSAHKIFDDKIDEYRLEIKQLERDKKYPLIKYFYFKTYKKLIGKLLKIKKKRVN